MHHDYLTTITRRKKKICAHRVWCFIHMINKVRLWHSWNVSRLSSRSVVLFTCSSVILLTEKTTSVSDELLIFIANCSSWHKSVASTSWLCKMRKTSDNCSNVNWSLLIVSDTSTFIVKLLQVTMNMGHYCVTILLLSSLLMQSASSLKVDGESIFWLICAKRFRWKQESKKKGERKKVQLVLIDETRIELNDGCIDVFTWSFLIYSVSFFFTRLMSLSLAT